MKKATTKSNPNCHICGHKTHLLFNKQILKKYQVSYFQCRSCQFIQTEEPYWLKEAYESPINIEDTGIVQRNLLLAAQLTPYLLTLDKNSKILDYGGGYGLFTRILRDFGFDAYWEDLYCENLLARGFESKPKSAYSVVTAFELFEHVEKPRDLVKNLISKAPMIIFSTLTSDGIYDLENWWYMGFSHGQHVSIYSKSSIRILADQMNLFSSSISNNLHIISKQPIPRYKLFLLKKYFSIFAPLSLILRKSKTYSDHSLLRQ